MARVKLDGGVLETDVQKAGAMRSRLAFVVLKGTAAVGRSFTVFDQN